MARMQYRPFGCTGFLICLLNLFSIHLLIAREQAIQTNTFYLPADPRYGPVESVLDSVGFTLHKTLKQDDRGHLVSISSFVDPDGKVMSWHDFGNLEGPGWAANAVGGAWEIYRLGTFLQKAEWQSNALAILDHV